ncbi:MAG: porin [Proteobacteria bacterium]|nr:porin [Pseudomonadota bacterium]
MKKLLLGSTALVAGGLMAAPAMAADPIKIGVGGYYQFFAMAGNIEGVYAPDGTSIQYKGLQFIQEGEIHFIGQTKLDNGTSIGLTVELEGWNPNPGAAIASQQIDEAFLFAFGDWGRLEFGSRDQASYRMYYGAPSALLGWGFFQHNSAFTWASQNMLNNPAQGAATFFTIGGQFQDVNRVNYFTPRFYGLQIGVGYAPKINLAVNAELGAGLAGSGPGTGAGICGYNNATTNNNCPTNDNSWQDVFDVGANYLNKFGDVTVALFGAYMYASFVPSFQNLAANNANTVTGANLTAWRQWVIGAQFGIAGFTVGGSIGWDNNGLGNNFYTGADNDSRKYAAAIMYETGPWQMSFGWGHVNTDNGNGARTLTTVTQGTTSATTLAAVPATSAAYFGTNPLAGAAVFGGYSADKFEVGVNYALGPGIKLVGGGIVWNVSGPTNGTQGQSWTAMLGMDLRF